jgi:uncharacterized protein YecE (DUF72 family)
MANLPHNLFIGTSGWSYPDWEGIFYPKRKPRGFDELRYLAQYFNAVELNNTFYRPPIANYAKGWVERTEDAGRFHFTLKLWQRFTHEGSAPKLLRSCEGGRERGPQTRSNAYGVPPYTEEDVSVFKRGIEPLAQSDRLGGILIQLPWSFQNTPETRDYLARVSRDFGEYRRFVEVRHSSWQNEESFRFFRELGLNWTNIDQPVSRSSVKPSAVVTGEAAYVRLHGRNYRAWFDKEAGRDDRYNYLYSDEELDEWVEKIQKLAQTVDVVYAFTNNHFRAQAPANALQIMSKLTGSAVDVPETLAQTYPFLRDIERKNPGDRTQRLF